MSEVVDAKGLACPEPVIRTKKALDEHDEVTVLVDNSTALENVKRLASVSGCATDVAEEPGGVFRIELRKGRGAAAPPVNLEGGHPSERQKARGVSPQPLPAEDVPRASAGPTIFVIASSVMGQGSDELGPFS